MLRSLCRGSVLLCATVGITLAFSAVQSPVARRTSHLYADGDNIGTADTDSPACLKESLMNTLSFLHNNCPDNMPCGLGCNEEERQFVSKMISGLCGDQNNLLVSRNGKIEATDIIGEWDLLYTSSRTMVINKSLSGLGRSSSESANFSNLRQKLTGNKYLGFVEFVETFGTGFEVTITGEWMLENVPFLAKPTTAIRVIPEKVLYGPTSNDAEMWDSLGPIKLLNICYLDEDLQITRGSVNPDAIFCFQRVK
jgi:hypothetical protein